MRNLLGSLAAQRGENTNQYPPSSFSTVVNMRPPNFVRTNKMEFAFLIMEILRLLVGQWETVMSVIGVVA